MNRRDFMMLMAAAGAEYSLSGCSSGQLSKKAEKRKPNVILIVGDDHGYADFSFKGIHDYIRTPNFDRLVRQGVFFTNAYATSPICNPSRCGILTGRYPQRWDTWWFGGQGIPENVPTIAENFKQLGYTSAYVGKLHYGGNDTPGTHSYPTEHGFDESLCAPPGGRIHYLHHSDNAVERYGRAAGQMNVYPMTKNGQKYEYEGFMTEKLGQTAIEFVRKNKDRPFFLQLAFNAVHNFTFQLPEEYLKQWDLPPYPDLTDGDNYAEWYNKAIWPNLANGRRYYAAQLYYMDEQIGRLMGLLKQLDLEKDTIIVYISDNGGSTCNCADNTPLKGTKYTLYEGGIRVPFIIRWPGRLKAGVVKDAVVSGMDICPTVLAAAGAGPELYSDCDGRNILPVAEGSERQVRETLFWDASWQWAVRRDKWKLKKVVNEKSADWIRSWEHAEPGYGTELYDLEKDPAEKKNLADENPQIVAELTELHRNWRKEIGKPEK